MTTEDLLRDATGDPSLDDALELAPSLQANLNAVVLGHPGRGRRRDNRRARCGTSSHRGRARRRQDHARQGGRRLDRHAPGPDPGSPGPAPVGHHRCLGLLRLDRRPGSSGPGPVFAHVVLFDELNRTPPRSQAALLEAMEERQVTVDGESWPLPEPHLVLATQNPIDQAGTFPLVESQMDRFLLATRLGYPDETTETRLALSHGAQPSLASLSPVCTPAGLAAAQAAVADVPVAPAVASYAVAVVRASRADPSDPPRSEPRAAIGLLAAARAHAVIAGRDFVLPDDVKAVAVSVLAHRLVTDAAPVGAFEAGHRGSGGDPRAGSFTEALMERRSRRRAPAADRERGATASGSVSVTWRCPNVPLDRSPARCCCCWYGPAWRTRAAPAGCRPWARWSPACCFSALVAPAFAAPGLTLIC